MPLVPGARLGPYEIVSALGAGGMGEVYKARDTRLDRTVAIKILPETVARDPRLRERSIERRARSPRSATIRTSARCTTWATRGDLRFSSCSTLVAGRPLLCLPRREPR